MEHKTQSEKRALDTVNSIDWLELKVRYLISQKDFVTAQANLDASLDGWRMDYAQWQNQLDSEIDQLLESFNRVIDGINPCN